MTNHPGRILLVVGAATIRMALIATVLACIAGARAVHAQAAPPPSWGDVGVHWSPVFWLEDDLDADYGTPAGVWVTWGTGTFRLQMAYQRSRQQYVLFGQRSFETYQGQQDTLVYRATQRTAVNHVGEVGLYWRLLEHSRVSPHLLFGLQYWNLGERLCVATGEPVPREPAAREPDGYHVDFAPGEEQRCGDDPQLMRRHLPHVVLGGGVDIALGSRVFVRVQAQFFQVRLGVGLRF